MAGRIEDYALIGDTHTVALVGPRRLDRLAVRAADRLRACFAALLGEVENGRWLLAPEGEVRACRRRYRDDTLILETEYETATGVCAVIDFMPVGGEEHVVDLVRLVEGRAGEVPMLTELVFRFDYGKTVPWVRSAEDGLIAIAGPDALRLHTPVELEGRDFRTIGRFAVRAGEQIPFRLSCFRSYETEPPRLEPAGLLAETTLYWRDWTAQSEVGGEWRDAVMRSLITLKALTYAPAGGIAAAGTTSLPERIGGCRNWDYRYCWIRDATFTLYAFLVSGLREEARQWREWLLRAAAGKPSQLQILYGVAGEREAPRARAAVARRLREQPAGAHRQRGACPAAARRLRRAVRRASTPRASSASRRTTTPGGSRRCCSTTSRASGRCPTRGSGRCAARPGTSPTPRSWPGSRPIARSRRSSASA